MLFNSTNAQLSQRNYFEKTQVNGSMVLKFNTNTIQLNWNETSSVDLANFNNYSFPDSKSQL